MSNADLEFRLRQAVNEIKVQDGVDISVRDKSKSLIKFGRNNDVGTTEETVWAQGGKETYATDNDIDSISSSNAGDAQSVVIEGHTLSGSDLTFVVQTATLNGQTPVTLSTPLYRATRVYNDDSTDFAGDIYVFESGGTVTAGVPQTATDIHLKVLAGDDNQSLKCATSLSSQDYWLLTGAYIGVNRQNTRSVDFRIKVRRFGKVFRTIVPPLAASNESGTRFVPFDPVIIVRPNSDVRIDATSSGTATGVSAGLQGYLANVIS